MKNIEFPISHDKNGMQMTHDGLRSQSLDLMRFPLAIVVTIVHITGSQSIIIDDNTTINISDFTLTRVFLEFVNSFLVNQSVPIYFFIAGYVFFLNIHLTHKTYIRKLRNRFHSLFIPYILWNALVILMILLPHIPPFNKPWIIDPDFSVSAIFNMFWDNSQGIIKSQPESNLFYPADAPLWFVRNLMIMALISPILSWLFRHTNYLCVVLSAIIWIIPATRYSGGLQIQEAFFFFSWGAWMSHRRRNMIVEFQKFFKISLIVYPMMALSTFLLTNTFPAVAEWTKTAAIISGLFFAYNASFWLISKGICHPCKQLTTIAFFIYSGHYIIISPARRLILKLIQPTDGISGLAYYVAMIAFVIGILMLTFAVLKRCAPRILSLFNGGRI